MKERPILFSGPMVRAILAGQKTQTRRLVKPQHVTKLAGLTQADLGKWDYERSTRYMRCPYGAPGDRLWVRETWRGGSDSMNSGLHYRADEDEPEAPGQWHPSIHMPRWASRITLEVTGVRVERLQDISEDDARAEGVTLPEDAPACPCQGEAEEPGAHLATCPWRDEDFDPTGSHHYDEFAILWNSINGKRAPWSSNPWVWVIAFERIWGAS